MRPHGGSGGSGALALKWFRFQGQGRVSAISTSAGMPRLWCSLRIMASVSGRPVGEQTAFFDSPGVPDAALQPASDSAKPARLQAVPPSTSPRGGLAGVLFATVCMA